MAATGFPTSGSSKFSEVDMQVKSAGLGDTSVMTQQLPRNIVIGDEILMIGKFLLSFFGLIPRCLPSWNKTKKVLFRTLTIFELLYGFFALLWLTEIVFKCRIPHQKKFNYISYYGLMEYEVAVECGHTHDEPLPGLACFPGLGQNVADYVSYTWQTIANVLPFAEPNQQPECYHKTSQI